MAAQEDPDRIADLGVQLELAVWGKIGNTLETSQAKRIDVFLSGVAVEFHRLTQEVAALRCENERIATGLRALPSIVPSELEAEEQWLRND